MFSIIIPCHNYAHYLPDAVNSVLPQLQKDDEVIIINDNSTDNTLTIAKELGIKVLTIVKNSPNESRKHGFNNTTQPYIIFLDADDTLAPDYLAKCREAISQSPTIVKTILKEFGDSSRVWSPEPTNIEHTNFLHIGTCVKRQAIVDTKAFDSANEFSTEDWEFWKRIYKQPVTLVEVDTFYNYRKHSNSRLSLVPRYMELTNVVLTTYLTHKAPEDQLTLVEDWVKSVIKTGLKPHIISDHPIPRILEAFPEIQNFVYHSNKSQSVFKERWRLVSKHLETYKHKSIVITDLFDVTIVKNPYRMFMNNIDIFLGSEPESISPDTKAGRWLLHQFRSNIPEYVHNKPILNCGIVAGWYKPVKYLVDQLSALTIVDDMPVLNRLVHNPSFQYTAWFNGEPLHSKFKHFETNRTDVCIIHK